MGLFTTTVRTNTHTHSEKLVPYVKTVHEHKAPTDESIKLYDEILAKTEKRLLSTFKVDTGVVEVIVMCFMVEGMSQALKYLCKFNLNNKELVFDFHIDPFELNRNTLLKSEKDKDKFILEKVVDVVSKQITKVLLSQVKTTELGLSKDYKLK